MERGRVEPLAAMNGTTSATMAGDRRGADLRQARERLLDTVEDRGRTTIDDRVIEAMAVRITTEEPEVGGAARRVWGVPVTGEDADRSPRVEATVAGEVVSLRVRLSVTYPAPVHAVTERVRRRLIDRLAALTGKRVGAVDVVVVALHRAANPGRVVG